MYIFFDTETSGLPRNYNAPLTDFSNWPRVVQIAWLLTGQDGEELASAEHIIKPVGFRISASAAKIHGITTEIALAEGIELKTALEGFVTHVEQASCLVAHNVEFDEKILGAEFLRLGMANPMKSKLRKCTMKEATNYCRLPGPYGYKWPSLTQLHQRLFNEPFANAHQALSDVRATARCFFELKRLDVM
ncbi:MAG: 3'-5' exonuclease [Lentisphaerae bacterium]|jgi:DNA polymerase-3 subunit epsilon|nr:3'-5' exonuclease [Lentisphaerota bacterium]